MATFWRPGTRGPGSAADRTAGVQEEHLAVPLVRGSDKQPLAQQRRALPVYQLRRQLLYLIENNNTTVVVGHTGCGKTTQIPQYLHESGWTANGFAVVCCQPRRVAATSVALRVAEERGVAIGQEVGYAIRFEERCDPDRTRIKYCTDGVLLRETMRDPLLTRYSVVVVDEAHERSVTTDILLGLLKKIQARRPDLRVVVSSATIDAQHFCDFFRTDERTAAIVSVEGRLYPVEVHYLERPVSDYVEATVDTVARIHRSEPPGDILAFLPGQDDIERAIQALVRISQQLPAGALKMRLLPLYASMGLDKQMRVFERVRASTRKIVIATNIAETSVTLDGCVYVVDSGFVKLRTYQPETGMDALVVAPVSQASANQRAGRAGRVRAGKCYRLCTEADYGMLPAQQLPEIQRSNIAPVVLQLKALGIDNILNFEFPSPPPAASMIRALEVLYALQALDDDGKLTQPLGEQLAEFPVDPMLGRMLLAAARFGCVREIASIAAMLSVQSVWPQGAADDARRRFAVREGDHLTMLNVCSAFMQSRRPAQWCQENGVEYKVMQRAMDVRKQLVAYLRRFGVEVQPHAQQGDDLSERIRRCIVTGFFAHAAKLSVDGQSYTTIKDGQAVHVHPASVLFKGVQLPPVVIYHEVVQTTKHYMREVTAIEHRWLVELVPSYFTYTKLEAFRERAAAEDGPPRKRQTAVF